MYMYVCIYIHVYFTSTYMYMHVVMNMNMNLFTDIYIYTSVCVYVYVCAHMKLCTCAYVCVYVWVYVSVRIRMFTYISIHCTHAFSCMQGLVSYIKGFASFGICVSLQGLHRFRRCCTGFSVEHGNKVCMVLCNWYGIPPHMEPPDLPP